jgi:hypothetical protein
MKTRIISRDEFVQRYKNHHRRKKKLAELDFLAYKVAAGEKCRRRRHKRQ